jgi:hypothetical protein
MQNSMHRQQAGLVFQAVKLLIYAVSGYLTYEFLTPIFSDPWFRAGALALYEGGLIFWHYMHHRKADTPRQHMFSGNMEYVSFLAVGSAAGYQLYVLVSHSFGDTLPDWVRTAIPVVTAFVFMTQILAFVRWARMSHYYEAVERFYDRQLSQRSNVLVSAYLPATATTKVVESAENPALPEATPVGDVDHAPVIELPVASDVPETMARLVDGLIQKTPLKRNPVRVEDRLLVLEALKISHPTLTPKQIADQTGLSERSVRRWQREGK